MNALDLMLAVVRHVGEDDPERVHVEFEKRLAALPEPERRAITRELIVSHLSRIDWNAIKTFDQNKPQ